MYLIGFHQQIFFLLNICIILILCISYWICKLYPVLKKLIQEDLFFTCLQKDMNTRKCYNIL